MSKIVLFVFAGREENLGVQLPYLTRLLDTYPEMEVHFWDMTRKAMDQRYLKSLPSMQMEPYGERFKIMDHLHPGHPIRCMYPGAQVRRRGYPPCRCLLHKMPFEKPYRWYAENAEEYQDTVFVKVDDDVLFLETDRFDDLITPLVAHPERVISANVINNAVSAKYEPDLVETYTSLGDPTDPENDKDWWALHTEPEFAKISHDWFLKEQPYKAYASNVKHYIKTREGEAISINCIAFTFRTMRWLGEAFKVDSRLGDEGAVDSLLPWICRTFHAAHLTFGPQEKTMSEYELTYYREQYSALSKGYLA